MSKKVKITKLSDDTFNGKHPNGIYEGYTKIGIEQAPPTLGDRYYVSDPNRMFNSFSTSPVKEIIDENNFKTIYSTYKIEYINE